MDAASTQPPTKLSLRRRLRFLWRRAIRSPVIVICLVIFLSGDIAYFSQSSRRHEPILGFCCCFYVLRVAAVPRMWYGWVEVIGGNEIAKVEYVHLKTPRAKQGLVHGKYISRDTTIGLFAPVVRIQEDVWKIEASSGTALSGDELAHYRQLFTDALIAGNWGVPSNDSLARLRSTDGTKVRVSPLWLMHDLMALFACVIVLASVPHMRRRWKRYTSRPWPGECPVCNYPIADLQARGETRCPECGNNLTRKR